MNHHVRGMPKPDMAGSGFIPLRMEEDTILWRVSRELYASPNSGVRELIANEITAARKARELGANPTIEVAILPGTISVQGFDSLGITRKIFEDVYTCLGRTGNTDPETPGQFGLGRASYVTISDHVLVETHPRGEDPYTFLGVEGRGYQVGFPAPDIPPGTRVTLVPRKDIHLGDIEAYVRRIAKFSPVPITVITPEGRETVPRDGFGVKTMGCGDVEFIPVYYGSESYLCGMPIHFRYVGPHKGVFFSVNVLDERKYPPTPDRERFPAEVERAISRTIDRCIEGQLGGIRDVRGLLRHPDAAMLARVSAVRLPVLRDTLVLYHTSPGRRLMDIVASGKKPILNCDVFDTRRIHAVLDKFPDAAFVKGAPCLQGLLEFIAEHGLIPSVVPDRFIVVHDRNGSYRVSVPEARDMVSRGDLWLASGRKELLEFRRLNEYRFTIHNVDGIGTTGELLGGALRRTYRTSRGDMTGSALVESSLPVYTTKRPLLVEHWGDGITGENITGENIGVLYDRGYTVLGLRGERLHGLGSLPGTWHGFDEALEAHQRLEKPLHRRMLAEHRGMRRHELCVKLLTLEGAGVITPQSADDILTVGHDA